MVKMSRKWRKGLLIGLGIFAGALLLVILCLSPILKHLVEKNDEKWLGRQITVRWVYANPLTGYVYLDDVKIFEDKSDTVFLKMDGISLRFDLRKLLSKEYQINYLTFIRPSGIVIQQTKDLFNFSDIVEMFA